MTHNRSPELFAILLLCACPVAAQERLTEPGPVQDCQPCLIRPSPETEIRKLTFIWKTAEGERTIESIKVSGETTAEAALPLAGMTPVGPKQQVVFGPTDIDFDGLADLVLITEQGMPNATALYWIFDRASGTYRELGQFPVFTLHPTTKTLSTFERGGYGGRIYEKKEYTVNAGKLILAKVEKQSLVRPPATFRRTISRRVGGRLQVSSRRILSGKQADIESK